jgi:hypothetical protein
MRAVEGRVTSALHPPDLERLAALLTSWGRPAAIIGGLAIVARVRERTTRDADVILSLDASEAETFLSLAVQAGYAFDEVETREFLEGGLMRLWGPPSRVEGAGLDILLADEPFLERVVERATVVSFAGVLLPVASVEDLVLLKLSANRPIDIDDVLAIRDVFEGQLDGGYLESSARALLISDRLELYFGIGLQGE